jgi:quinol monooxygenase YgiN/mannose-6-phosphate isomerase-like protein (cupin superfamily)
MAPVGRYAKAMAKPGRGDELAGKLLEVAEDLRDAPGCELYLINRSPSDPDAVWVTELWQSQELLDAALERPEARARMPEVLGLVLQDGFERIDVEPLGGVGYDSGTTGYAVVNLGEVEDMAPRFGFGDSGEARFARAPLGAREVGVSLHRLRPGARQAFGHRHHRDEEIYVVLAGGGLMAIDGELRELAPLDAVRVAPASIRAFEAGPDGLELLAMGAHHAGDAHIEPGYWAD